MNALFHTTLGDIADAVKGSILCGERDVAVESITSDSRETGSGALFVPIVGEKFDGHDFIENLCAQNKISAFLTSRDSDRGIALRFGVGAVLCSDTLHALASIARVHRSAYKGTLVAVTGTNGKTTTKELLSAILSSDGTLVKSEKNYNNEIGAPFTLMGLSDQKWAVIELGMNHAGEISRLTSAARPDLAIITNAGEGHLEFLGSVENVAHAKAEIMEGMAPGSTILLNEESLCIEIMRRAAKERDLSVVTFGVESGDVYPDSFDLGLASTELVYKGVLFSVPLFGLHNVSNIMAAVACAELLGIPLEQSAQALRSFVNVGKRNDITEGAFAVINDTYNSNPLSLRYALRSLGSIYKGRRTIAVLSDMKELGDHAKKCHLDSGAEVAMNGFARLYTWGELSGFIAQGAVSAGMDPSSVMHFSSKDELIQRLTADVKAGDAVLVKGSRSMKMEEVADTLVRYATCSII
jgi:UDP-N-acetylmuramoyl-tripeptide--D-alanyl-D-alanine ligase